MLQVLLPQDDDVIKTLAPQDRVRFHQQQRIAPASHTPSQKNQKPPLVRLEFRAFDLSRRDDQLLAKQCVLGDQLRPGPRQVLESASGKLTGTGRFADGSPDPGHHAGDLGTETEAQDREHARLFCSMSVSRSSLACPA